MFATKENSLNESDSQAEYLCRQSIARAGFAYGDAPATFHWSQLVNPAGDKNAAVAAYEELLKQEPENKSALEGLAFIYQTQGKSDQALNYRKVLREVEARDLGVDINAHPEAVNFLLAKTGEAPQPDRVPAAYVGAHFDQYALNFDTQLCEILEYKGHLLVEELCLQISNNANNSSIDSLSNLPNKKLNALDIGCGTGLTGQAIEGLFSRVDGVDLSDKMLSIARQRNVYARLENTDYHDFLADNISSYDVITASDVLIYEGDLSDIFKLVSASLKTSGHFIFTLEKGHTETFCLRNTGRYQHNADYVLELAKQYGFSAKVSREVVLRINEGQAVEGYLFEFEKIK